MSRSILSVVLAKTVGRCGKSGAAKCESLRPASAPSQPLPLLADKLTSGEHRGTQDFCGPGAADGPPRPAASGRGAPGYGSAVRRRRSPRGRVAGEVACSL